MRDALRPGRITVLLFFILALVIVLGNPYQFADGNSGRYLPNLYRMMDPSLFPADPVADAFLRFVSLFYTGMGGLMRLLRVPVLKVEPVFYGMYVASRLLLLAAIYQLLKELKQDAWVFLILGAWVAHQKSAAVGGDSLFAPTVTHATVAVLIVLIALIFLVRENHFVFWCALALAVLVHSLLALQLALIVFPVLVWQLRGRFSKGMVAGLFVFAGAVLVYLVWMTPPAFSAQETSLFLAAKGTMVHISPLAQPWTGWASILGRVALALLAWKLFLSDDRQFSLLAGIIVSGTLLASAIGFAAILADNLRLTQLQPMRMFEWVNFLVFVMLSCATLVAWKKDRLAGAILLITILLNILDSLWGLAWLYFGIVSLAVYWFAGRIPRFSILSASSIRAGSALLAFAALGMWIFGKFHSFESFRDPIPVFIVISCLAMSFWPMQHYSMTAGLVIGVVIVTLISRSVYVYHYISVREYKDFNSICNWIALNTLKQDKFITAVLDGGNFRALAMRTTLNESQSALYWVAPLVAVQNADSSQKVLDAWDGANWDMNALYSLAQDWDADYVLLEGRYSQGLEPMHNQGDYHIFIVP